MKIIFALLTPENMYPCNLLFLAVMRGSVPGLNYCAVCNSVWCGYGYFELTRSRITFSKIYYGLS
jgi:hypothetical protein